MSAARILILDDDPMIQKTFAALLEAAEFEVAAAGDARAAYAALDAEPTALLLLDDSLRGASGLELVPTLRARWPTLKILLVTGLLPDRLPDGLVGALEKPVPRTKLLAAVTRALAPD